MTNKTDPYVACSSLEWKLGIHLGEWRASRNLAKRMGKEPSTDVAYLQGVKDLLNDYLSSFQPMQPLTDPLTVTRTERGWAGHFICANRCQFRRNTLLQCGSSKIVVSTVGLLENISRDGIETVGAGRYYETMAFHADYTDLRYFDADVSREIQFESPWQVSEINADDVANNQHEAVVDEITQNLAAGKTYTTD